MFYFFSDDDSERLGKNSECSEQTVERRTRRLSISSSNALLLCKRKFVGVRPFQTMIPIFYTYMTQSYILTDTFAVFASSKKIFSSLIVCLRTPQLFLLRIGRCYLSVTRGPPAKVGPYCLTGQTKMTSSPLHLLAGCSFFPRSSTPRYWIHPE